MYIQLHLGLNLSGAKLLSLRTCRSSTREVVDADQGKLTTAICETNRRLGEENTGEGNPA